MSGDRQPESVETALKIAIADRRVKGEGTRQRSIGRERGYHGVGFGGISVGGIGTNRKFIWQFARGSRSFASHSQSRTQCFGPQTTGMGSAFGG